MTAFLRTGGFLCATLFASFLECSAQSPVELEVVQWASGLTTALDITNCGDDRLFVVRQYGAIAIVTDSNTVLPTPFLDISSQVLYNGERGLLGMAFDPDYVNNGHFYVNYTTGTGNGTTRISRFTVGPDPNIANPSSEVILLTLPQPDPIHQSGSLVFGPDGYLYVALGDGGGASDPNDEGQDPTTLFGTIIRIDPQADGSYSIPADNPFVGNPDGWREEIWAYGLRNPYRMGIDPLNGDLWIGDVGQSLWEEIDHWPGGDNSGPNFGWKCYEGNDPFELTGCGPASGYIFPVATHAHSVNGGNFCAIVGGEVYRGDLFARLQGRYIYTDFCSGEFRMITHDDQGGWVNELGLASGLVGLTSIGTDRFGELYATNLINGRVYKIKDRCPMAPPEIMQDGSELVSSEALAYQWYLNGDPIAGATSQIHGPEASGYYHVLAGYGNGCEFPSDSILYIFTDIEVMQAGLLSVHPQPAQDRLILTLSAAFRDGATVRLLDLQGRALVVTRTAAGAERVEWNLNGFASGVYVVEIRDLQGSLCEQRSVSIVGTY